MPVAVHHAVMFVVVFVLLVSMMLSVVYVLVNNMLSDAYRYERFLEKANEKVRVGGVIYFGRLHYGVRNLGLTKIDLAEIGYIDDSGNRYTLDTSVSLDPGRVYRSARDITGGAISVYVVTGRGNVFSGPVTVITSQTSYDQIRLRTLLPAVHHVLSPISPSTPGSVSTITINTFSYVFGFVVAKDLNSDDSAVVEFGPYNVATFFKTCSSQPNCQPSFVDSRSASSGSVSVSARLIFSAGRTGASPTFRVAMPLSVQNTRQGVFVRGCVGVLWRAMSTTFFSLAKSQTLPGWSYSGQGNYFSDDFEVLLFPSSVNLANLRVAMSNLGDRTWEQYQYADPPSGSIIEVYLVRCFTIVHRTAQQVAFSPDSDPSYTTPAGHIMWSSLVFPGTNKFHPSDITISDIPLSVYVDLDMVLKSLIG